LYRTQSDEYRGAIIGGSQDFAPVINVAMQFHVMGGNRSFLDCEQIRAPGRRR
jgi:hypothetical protein